MGMETLAFLYSLLLFFLFTLGLAGHWIASARTMRAMMREVCDAREARNVRRVKRASCRAAAYAGHAKRVDRAGDWAALAQRAAQLAAQCARGGKPRHLAGYYARVSRKAYVNGKGGAQ